MSMNTSEMLPVAGKESHPLGPVHTCAPIVSPMFSKNLEVPRHVRQMWDNTTTLISKLMGVPAALIMRVHESTIEVFSTANNGYTPYRLGELAELNTGLYCETVIKTRGLLEVPNATIDPKWDHNPDLTDGINMVSYLGLPILWPNQVVFGTICVLDRKPVKWSEKICGDAIRAVDIITSFRDIVQSQLHMVYNDYLLQEEHLLRLSINEELKRAVATAEENAAVKTRFISWLSHELRTPIHGLTGLVDLIIEDVHIPAQIENLRGIAECTQTLLSLIGDVLDFSKIEADMVVFECIPVGVMPLCKVVLSMMQPLAVEGVVLSTDFHDLPGSVLTDPLKLRQILLNVLSNALKFTEHGTVKLVVEFMEDEEILRFSVTDSGAGIDPTRHEAIFLPFAQAEVSDTRKHGGAGLGLAVCRGLVERMGGSIYVDKSTVGVGTTMVFTIHAPLSDETPVDLVTPPHSPNIPHPLLPHKQHESRILIADDNSINRLVMQKLLCKLGWSTGIDEANDGIEAVEMATATQYSLVFMDLQMPGLDGIGATYRIREMEAKGGEQCHVHVPIIAVTAEAGVEVHEKCMAAGMVGVVTKPFGLEVLKRTIEKFLK